MIDPFVCYRIFLSIRAHFETENYDAIEHNGKVKTCSREKFEQRNDHRLFCGLSKQLTSVQHAASYFVANFAYGDHYPLEDIDKGFVNYNKWQRIRQSLTKHFVDDLMSLSNTGMTYNELLSCDKGIAPLFLLLKNGKVNIETVAILNSIDNFTDTWKKKTPIWKEDFLRIKKLARFVKFDAAKFQNFYCNFKEELKENHETMA